MYLLTYLQWISNCLDGDFLSLVLIASLRSCWFVVVGLRTLNPAGYPKCSNLKDYYLENMMPIHQQLWSLECSVVETVASLLCGMIQHCLAWRQSRCPDKVDDIQAVRKFSSVTPAATTSWHYINPIIIITQQISITSGQLLFSVDQWKRYVFHSKKLRCFI